MQKFIQKIILNLKNTHETITQLTNFIESD